MIKTHIPALLLAAFLAFVIWQMVEHVKVRVSSRPASHPSGNEAFFPASSGIDAVVREIGTASGSIRIRTSSLTSDRITDALVYAVEREVLVAIILDKTRRVESQSCTDALNDVQAVLWIDPQDRAGDTYMVIDQATVITGGFASSQPDERGGSLLIIHDGNLAGKHLADWERHRQHSEPFEDN